MIHINANIPNDCVDQMDREHKATQLSCSYVLKSTRKSKCGYDADVTRTSLTTAVKSAFNGNEPRTFQLDVAETLMLGLDATAIAGTGSGKTPPWAMQLLLEENKAKTVLVMLPPASPVTFSQTMIYLAPPKAPFANNQAEIISSDGLPSPTCVSLRI